jgi:hypothetical protein
MILFVVYLDIKIYNDVLNDTNNSLHHIFISVEEINWK